MPQLPGKRGMQPESERDNNAARPRIFVFGLRDRACCVALLSIKFFQSHAFFFFLLGRYFSKRSARTCSSRFRTYICVFFFLSRSITKSSIASLNVYMRMGYWRAKQTEGEEKRKKVVLKRVELWEGSGGNKR